MYEITYNITKKGRVAARPFSCLLEVFLLYHYDMHLGDYLRMEYII